MFPPIRVSHIRRLTVRMITAVAMGSVTQFRLMEGAITLSIINTAYNTFPKSYLKNLLTPAEINAILDSRFTQISHGLEPGLRSEFGIKLAERYNL
jgi:hypothetical protein